MGIIIHNLGMLVSMWIVLGLIALNALVGLIAQLRGKTNLGALSELVTRPILLDVFPLILIALLTRLPNFQLVMLIWYYVAAILIAIRSLMALGKTLKK